MTDNQFSQLFDLVTKCVGGIQRIEHDVSVFREDVNDLKEDVGELKQDVSELKQGQAKLEQGQARLEKEAQITNRALSILTDDSIRTRARVEILEQQ